MENGVKTPVFDDSLLTLHILVSEKPKSEEQWNQELGS
jgi:hypothetical protein